MVVVFDGQSDEGRGCWWWCLMDRVMRAEAAGGGVGV